MFRIDDSKNFAKYNSVKRQPIVNELRNIDFQNGPVYLTNPGIYKLVEDIEFNPFSNFSDIFDSLASYPEANHHFVLGYFAAIIINGINIELDLNGFTIKQSYLHNLQQRFFALIELADRPFLPGQGPANFGTEITSCRDITIRNGILGLSSHYGIHGNNMENVKIKDLTIYNFEVAGISLNGGHNIQIDNVEIRHNYQHIKVTGLFSNAIFTAKKLMLKQRENAYASIIVDGKQVTIDTIINRLVKSITDAYLDIVNNQPVGTINSDSKIYDNSINNYLLDGNCYGIALNTIGLLVNEYKQSYEAKNSQITLSNIIITDIKSKPVEHLTITETPLNQLGLNPQTLPEVNKGAFGDVLLYFNAVDKDGKFTNESNPLILAQILGAVKVSEILMNWITTGSSDFYERISQLTVLNNLDIMAHVFKGNIGLFISSGINITCNNITVKNISNYSTPGKEEHVQRDHDYIGSRVSGITVVSSQNVNFNTVLIDNLYSDCGQVFGFYHYGKCSGINRTNCNIHSLVTNVDYNTIGTTPRTKHISQSIGVDKTFTLQ
jgi:hypothetical protein